jgi:hypothetical protein
MLKSWVIGFLSIVALLLSCKLRPQPQLPKTCKIFENKKDTVVIPFTRYRGWIIIKVSVNGSRPLSFILDTGAPIALLSSSALADSLHLSIMGNVQLHGGDNKKASSVPLASSVQFKTGNLLIENGLLAVGTSSNTISGTDGIIGKYIFDDAIVKIDWNGNNIIIAKPGKPAFDTTGKTIAVKTLSSGHIYTDALISTGSKTVAVKAIIDFGNRSSFSLSKNVEPAFNLNDNIIRNTVVMWGPNGPVNGDISKINLSFGSFELQDIPASFSEYNEGFLQDSINANIGLSVLEKFNMVIDYSGSKIILQKNKNFNKPFVYNRSGIILNPEQNAGYVLAACIIKSSPAKESGLENGDTIVAFNNQKIPVLSRDEIDSFVVGRNVNTLEVSVLRNEHVMRFNVKMRDLLK